MTSPCWNGGKHPAGVLLSCKSLPEPAPAATLCGS